MRPQNEKEAKIVRYIFKAYAKDGASWATMVRKIEDMGATTKLGNKLWDTERLRNILKNDTYTGTKYFNTCTLVREQSNPIRGLKYGKKVARDKSEWIGVKVPVIISQELFDKAQRRLEESRKAWRRPNETRLLTGLANCGLCGKFFVSYFRTYKDRRRKADPGTVFQKTAYRCSTKTQQRMHSKNAQIQRCNNPEVLTHLLENCVLGIVKETMTDPSRLMKCMDRIKGKARTNQWRMEKKLKNAEQTLIVLEKQKRDIVDQYAKAKIDRATYAARLDQNNTEIELTKTERLELIQRIPDLHKKDIVEVSVKQYCESVKARLAVCKDNETLRKFLKEYVGRIVYNNTEVTVQAFVPIRLKAYEDPDQTSEASKIAFEVHGQIKRGNKWMNKNG